MSRRNWLALTVSLVLVGMSFLTPSSPAAAERPEVHFLSHGTTPAPVEYVSTTFNQESTSTVSDLVSVFWNISEEPVTAIKVSWTVHGRSGGKMSATVTMDALPFGDEESMGGKPYLSGTSIEVPSEATLGMPDGIERIEVRLDFVETPSERNPGVEWWPNYAEVWPSRSESWRNMAANRRRVAAFRSFLVREADKKGLARIEEILQMVRERLSETVPMRPRASAPGSEPCSSYPKFGLEARLDEMVIESIEICGTFAGDPKPLQELIGSKIETKPGDRYDPDALKKDSRAVWSLGRVDSLRVGFMQGKRGIILVFEVQERS
jgi:hypothetical protein